MQGENPILDMAETERQATPFPMERYFQVHFEFMQQQLLQALTTLDDLQDEVNHLQGRILAREARAGRRNLSERQAAPRTLRKR